MLKIQQTISLQLLTRLRLIIKKRGWGRSGIFLSAFVLCAVLAPSFAHALDLVVTPQAGVGGSIPAASPMIVSYGSTTSFTITPDSGNAIASVSGCSGSLIGNTFTTGTITTNCTVLAMFANAAGDRLGMVHLPRTGQTSCWDSLGNMIDCTGTMQDGEIQAGAPEQAQRYTDNGETIIDTLTNLQWPTDATMPTIGPCAGGNGSWQASLDYVACLNSQNYLGYSDWRMPNIVEIGSLVSLQWPDTAIWMYAWGVPNATGLYWSSTTVKIDPASAYRLRLDGNDISATSKSDTNVRVWPVRAGVCASPSSQACLPKTGQKTSYAANDDGNLQQGVDWPSPRFTNMDNSTPIHGVLVLDQLTGLVWQQGPSVSATWQDALDYVAGLNAAHYLGYADWRLPNYTELRSLLNSGEANSSLWLRLQGVISSQQFSWSSTTFPSNGSAIAGYMVNLNMNMNQTGLWTKDGGYVVWPVRSGSAPAFTQAGVTKTGDGGGVVSAGSGTMIWSGMTGTVTYVLNTQVTLTALAGAGSYFTGWSGDCTGMGACTLLMNAHKTVTANFVLINGSCGLASGMSTTTPAAGLCAVGNASAVSGSGPWTWNCSGLYTGSTATCVSNVLSYTVTPQAGIGGAISAGTPQTIMFNTSTNFTITPDNGNSIVSVTGCNGSLNGTTYTTGLINAACTVLALFANSSGTLLPAIQLPRTGQTICYDAAGSVIDCTGTMQDGELQAGSAWPVPRYSDNNDQTIIDAMTGLEWPMDASTPTVGVCSGGMHTWQEAFGYVACLNQQRYLGYSDWRLPNLHELSSLINMRQPNIANWIYTQGATNAFQGIYWSSTTEAGNIGKAWRVQFGNSDAWSTDKTEGWNVWPVRAGQCGTSGPAQSCLSRTGQTISYAPGDDGAMQSGAAWPGPRFTKPDGSALTNDGVVLDRLTGLMWQQNLNAMVNTTWQSALDYIAGLNALRYLGYSDWRLPNVGELSSLVNRGQANSAAWLNSQGFVGVPSAEFMTSTTYADNGSFAWAVNMIYGQRKSDLNKGTDLVVWPVRSGQSPSFTQANINKTGIGSGVVSTNIGTIIWSGMTGTATYLLNTQVTLTAVADAGSYFTGWSGECNGTGGCALTLDAYKTVSANFILINGACGLSSGQTYTTQPAANLCVVGNASSLSGSGPWTWSCDGLHTGTSANCRANILTYTVLPQAGVGGSISPAIAQKVVFNTPISFAIAPALGNTLLSVSGCNGTLSGSTYTTDVINDNCSVLALFMNNGVQLPAIQLPRTGQSACYDAVGNPIACVGTAQDGEIKAGAVWPNPKYRVNNDQTLTDMMNGLQWPREAGSPTIGPCSGGSLSWQAGLDYVACLNQQNYLGYDDWRIPNINELKSLLNAQQYDASVWMFMMGARNPVSWTYWSSTTYAFNTGQAWAVDFTGNNSGPVDKATGNTNLIWPVRDGQCDISGNKSCVAATGQSTSYATGDDGDFRYGVAWPAPRFTNPGGSVPVTASVVVDQLTGLMWQTHASIGQGLNWQGALDYIAGLNTTSYLGYSDWRLPNRSELASLVDYDTANVAYLLDAQGFLYVQTGQYWTSTTNVGNAVYAWYVDLLSGNEGSTEKWQNLNIWPVRGGQAGTLYNLAVAKTGNGVGIVTANAGSILWSGMTGTATYLTNTPVTLTATATAGSYFIGWSGACAGRGICSITMDRLQSVTADFVLINGSCGLSSGMSLTMAPSTDLCAIGSASTISGSGPWTWTCAGLYSGSTASCVANILTWTVTPQAGVGGSISPHTPQAVVFSTPTSFTIVPDAGNTIVSVNGCGGTLSGTSYATSAINANCTVLAIFAKDGVQQPAIQLPRTNQTTCYDTAGTMINCTGTAQDGEYRAGVAWPNPRYSLAGSVLMDAMTGLVWPQNAGTPTVGDCIGGGLSWQTGLDYVACLNTRNYLGHNDWRMPNINELASLVNAQWDNPAVWMFSQGALSTVSDRYWSSTTYAPDASRTWSLHLGNGGIDQDDKNSLHVVWPVRGGQCEASNPAQACIASSGQTTVFATGDDGSFQTGIAWPNPRFTNPDGSTPVSGIANAIMDQMTGLMWKQDYTDSGNPFGSSWQTAFDVIVSMNTNSYLGYNDWRLPNRDELASLVNYGAPNVAFWLNASGFSNVHTSSYWSSTTVPGFLNGAWSVDLNAGSAAGRTKSDGWYVWAVRGGQVGSLMTLNIAKTGTGSGVVSANSGMVLWSGQNGSAVYMMNTAVTLTAAPGAGSSFVGWSGACTGTGACVLTMDGSKHVTAQFDLPVVNGTCGPSNGQTLFSAPTDSLCSVGNATTVTGIGPWTWSCTGLNGGTNAGCLAALNTHRSLQFSADSSWSAQTNATTGLIVITVVDDAGSPAVVASNTPITVSSSSASGQFSENGVSFGGNVIYPQIPMGGSSVYVLYKDSSSGVFPITASGMAGSNSASWQSVNHPVTITAPALANTVLSASATQNAVYGQGIAVSGIIKDAASGAAISAQPVYLVLISPSGGQSPEYTSYTGSDGSYVFSIGSTLVEQGGNWGAKVTFKGISSTYNPTSIIATFPIAKADTSIGMTLDAASVSTVASVVASGQLASLTTSAVNLAGMPIVLDLISPSGPISTVTTTTYDTLGHYQQSIGPFSQTGIWSVRARFGGNTSLNASVSGTKSLTAATAAGYAILIEGESGQTNRPIYTATLDDVRQRLISRGLTDADIFYLSFESNSHPGVSAQSTKANIQYAIETWAYAQMSQRGTAPLFIVMIDHGAPGQFMLGSEVLTPEDLNASISKLESKMTTSINTVIVDGSCYSGSFTQALSRPGRVVITSSAADEQSAQGPSVGSSVYGEYFIYYLFYHLSHGKSVEAAFVEAGNATQQYRRCSGGCANAVGFHSDAKQHPTLNDRGDGQPGADYTRVDEQGNNDNGKLSSNIALGIGTNPVTLDWAGIAPAQKLMLSDPTSTVYARTTVVATSSWIEIMKPSFQMPDSGGSGQVLIKLPAFPGTYNQNLGQWEYVIHADVAKGFSGFDEPGTYTVYYYAVDGEGSITAPAIGTIYVNTATNLAPTPCNLISPANAAEQTNNMAVFSWSPSSDPDGDPVSYTLRIYEDTMGQKGAEIKRYALAPQAGFFINAATAFRDSGAPLFVSGSSYWWDVEAIDDKGASSTSTVNSLNIVFTNALAAVITGQVTDAVTGRAIAGATINVNGATVTSMANGAYIASTTSGAIALSATAAGYQNMQTLYLNVASGNSLKQQISMSPQHYTLTVNTSGAGSGTINSGPAGINCGGSCSSDYTYGTQVVLTPVASIGSSFIGWTGACTDAGTCIVTMTGNANVIASFAVSSFSVTPSAGSGGSIIPDMVQDVDANGIASFTITPDSGFHIDRIDGCGGMLTGAIFTTGPTTTNCTVHADFAADLPDTVSVTPSAGTGGAISPNNTRSISAGGATTFAILPNAGYQIETVMGCNGALSGNIYTTGPVTANCTITASFTLIPVPPNGHLVDNPVTIADALRALRIAVGFIQPTADDLAHGDVAPLVKGVPQPDGKIDIGDVIVILRRSVGLVSW